MAEEDEQDFMGYAGRNNGKAMFDDMQMEKNLSLVPEPSAEEREYERRLQAAERDKAAREREKERKREKKSKDKKDKKDKKRAKGTDKKKRDKKDKKSKGKGRGSSSSSSSSGGESDGGDQPAREEVLALDQQLRELGVPVRVFGERHLDRLKRWHQVKEQRAAKAAAAGGAGGGGGTGSAANPNREGWMTMASHETSAGGGHGAGGGGEGGGGGGGEGGGESAKAAALVGSLDSLLMGTSHVSEKQQKRANEAAGGIERNEDQPAFLKQMADIKEGRCACTRVRACARLRVRVSTRVLAKADSSGGRAPGAPGLWVPTDADKDSQADPGAKDSRAEEGTRVPAAPVAVGE